MDADLQLMEQWRGGDASAGQALFAKHFESVYRFFAHKVGADADELVQQTFTGCLIARDQFRGQSSFRTYLFAIARHELYDHFRRQRRDVIDFAVTSLAEIATSPSGLAARAEEVDRMRGALASLPVEQQVLLELHYWHDLGPAELSEVLGLTAGNVRVRLSRGRKALREKMAGVAAPGQRSDGLSAALAAPEADDGEEADVCPGSPSRP
jgi:RNA polymerase sigma factor (sigma-70 family)